MRLRTARGKASINIWELGSMHVMIYYCMLLFNCGGYRVSNMPSRPTLHLNANIHTSHAWVVVGDLLIVRNPGGEVNMLILGLAGQTG